MTVLNMMKNVITGLTPAPPAEPSPETTSDAVKKAQACLEQKRQRRETTKAEVERFTADLAAAHLALEQADTAEGACLVNGLDATAAMEVRREASDRVRVLGSAVTIATQIDQVAQTELQQAERELKHAAKDEARERLLALTEQAEELLARVKRLRSELVREAAAAHSVGAIESWGRREVVDHWDFFLKIANRSAADDAADSGAFRKFPSWTYCVMYACGKIKP